MFRQMCSVLFNSESSEKKKKKKHNNREKATTSALSSSITDTQVMETVEIIGI